MSGPRDAAVTGRWFVKAFGVQEKDYEGTRELFDYSSGVLQVKATGQKFYVGPFEVVSGGELHKRLHEALPEKRRFRHSPFTIGDVQACEADELGGLTFKNVVDRTLELIADPQNSGSVFQVASLYNCLQMQEPGDSPEDGVTCYAETTTQGSVCAIACPAATVFRNYFLNGVGQGRGQQQIDLLTHVGDLVGNRKEGYWVVRNGFMMPRPGGKLIDLGERLASDQILADDVASRVRVGVHWDTQVLLDDISHNVCQVCCSAPAVAFSKIVKAQHWAPFAISLLTGAYDATLAAGAILAARRRQRVKVFLTAIGAGALGNRPSWIYQAVDRVLEAYKSAPLDVYLIHFSRTDKFERLQGSRPEPVPRNRSTLDDRVAAMQKEVGEANMLHKTQRYPMMGSPTAARDNMSLMIAKAFAYFDSNGDGVIDIDECTYILRSLDPAFFTQEKVRQLAAQADADSDGYIHYAEFIAWILDSDSVMTSRVLAASSFVAESMPDGILPESPLKLASRARPATSGEMSFF